MQNSYRQLSFFYFVFLVAILWIFGYTPTNDGEGYIEFANVCIKEGQPYPCLALIKSQPFIWNIGSINLTLLFLKLFHSVYPLLILMCLLKAMTAYYIAKTTELLFDHRTGLIVLLLYCLYPNNWGQSTTILSEIPMTFFAMLALYIFIKGNSIKAYVTGGVLMAIANWFRPIGIIFILCIALYMLFFKKKKAFRNIAFMLTGYAAVILTIGTESYLRTGYFVYQAESLWFNMSEAIYETSVEPHYNSEMFPKGTPRYIENMEEKTCFQCDSIWRERSINWLKDHPTQYLSKVPGRLAYMYYNDIDNIVVFLPDKTKSENNYLTLPYRNLLRDITHLSTIQYIALFATVVYFLLMLAAILGAAVLIRNKKWQQAFIPLFIIVGGSLALVLAVHGETRFKAPYMPFIFMLAAAFINQKKKEINEE